MIRIEGTALLRISQSTCLAYFTSYGLQSEEIANVVYRQSVTLILNLLSAFKLRITHLLSVGGGL